ncbi:seizure protein 6 homolog, partial [Amblyomma americanum]
CGAIWRPQGDLRARSGVSRIAPCYCLCIPAVAFANAPAVVPVPCPAPPSSIANGVVVIPQQPLLKDAEVQYRCNPGYRLIGDSVRVCQGDGTWSGPEPTCQGSGPPPAGCPSPGSIANGAVDVPAGALVVNTKVQYRCNQGYTLVGNSERTCQSDGTWSGAEPTCQGASPPASCTRPGSIANGAVDVPAGALVVNTKVQYRCNQGYTLVGNSERTCQSDGIWSGAEPTCQATAPPPQPPQPPQPQPGPQPPGPMPDPHGPPKPTEGTPAGGDASGQGSSLPVLLSLLSLFVVGGAVLLYLAYHLYLSRPSNEEEAGLAAQPIGTAKSTLLQ